MSMDFSAWFTLGLTLVAGFLLITERLRPDLTAVLVLCILGLSSILPPDEIFAGFSGSAVMIILGISIVSEGLRQSGAAARLGHWLSKLGGHSEPRLILAVTLASATLSLIMNNIAVAGFLLPAIMALSRKTRVPPVRLLIPLAFGTTLGGMATLLTTANIIVSGALRDAGYEPFGLLDFMPVGGPLILIGLVYLITVGRKLLPGEGAGPRPLPQHGQQLASLYHLDEYLFEVEVQPNCPFVNRTIGDADWDKHTNLTILSIQRENQKILAPEASVTIRTGDRLTLKGNPSKEQLRSFGLNGLSQTSASETVSSAITVLAELVVSPHANLIGRSLRSIHFRERFGVTVLGIWRAGKPILSKLGDLPLQFGDALLVQGPAATIHRLNLEPELILLGEDPDSVLKPRKFFLTIAITLLALALVAFTTLSVPVVFLSAALLMVLTGCLSMNEAYQAIDWKVIFLIAGMWPLSTAIRMTGLAQTGVDLIFNSGVTIAPLLAAFVLLLIALSLVQIMSAQVASLVLAPVALAVAYSLGADPRALSMAVALGCSLAFITPYGHPVNLMVMSPGGYKTRDFVRIGLPLTVLVIAGILLGLHFFWGL